MLAMHCHELAVSGLSAHAKASTAKLENLTLSCPSRSAGQTHTNTNTTTYCSKMHTPTKAAPAGEALVAENTPTPTKDVANLSLEDKVVPDAWDGGELKPIKLQSLRNLFSGWDTNVKSNEKCADAKKLTMNKTNVSALGHNSARKPVFARGLNLEFKPLFITRQKHRHVLPSDMGESNPEVAEILTTAPLTAPPDTPARATTAGQQLTAAGRPRRESARDYTPLSRDENRKKNKANKQKKKDKKRADIIAQSVTAGDDIDPPGSSTPSTQSDPAPADTSADRAQSAHVGDRGRGMRRGRGGRDAAGRGGRRGSGRGGGRGSHRGRRGWSSGAGDRNTTPTTTPALCYCTAVHSDMTKDAASDVACLLLQHGSGVEVAFRGIQASGGGRAEIALVNPEHVARLREIVLLGGYALEGGQVAYKRFTLVVPHVFRGMDKGLFLESLANYNSGMPRNALILRGQAEEAAEGERTRCRIWVDVTSEGVTYLTARNFKLRTVTSELAFRPAQGPSNRPSSNN